MHKSTKDIKEKIGEARDRKFRVNVYRFGSDFQAWLDRFKKWWKK